MAAQTNCHVCGQDKGNLISAALISAPMNRFIRNRSQGWDDSSYICYDDLNRFRMLYIEDTIAHDKAALSRIGNDIIESFDKQELISKNLFSEFDTKQTVGERLADRVSKFGGSWSFITVFITALLLWIAANTILVVKRPFDPYPFILLNLVLSCIAAIQAPVIMMSQRRIEARDRLRSELDYQVNTKAEIEIKNLHEKVDHLIITQWQRLLEIQQFQIELMQELLENAKK